MTGEQDWARVAAGASRGDTLTADERENLLTLALTLGGTVTELSVGSSITQATADGWVTPAASSTLALDLDLAQYASSDGPCVSACRDGQRYDVSIMSDEQAFPAFTAAARIVGVGSSLSVPLPNRPAMALNLYASDPHAFADDYAQRAASLLARCVGHFLPGPGEHGVTDEDEWRKAVAERQRVDRARDVIARRDRATPQAALSQMIEMSRSSGMTMLDVATAVCAEPELS